MIHEVLQDVGVELPVAKLVELQWDLWIVNGMLEFGVPIKYLVKEREQRESRGEFPSSYAFFRQHV